MVYFYYVHFYYVDEDPRKNTVKITLTACSPVSPNSSLKIKTEHFKGNKAQHCR